MLSPQLRKFIETSEKNEGFDLKDAPVGTLLRIRTQNHVYDMLIVKPDGGLVVLQSDNEQLKKPSMVLYQGATDGGSAVRLGRISVGLHMRMSPANGGLFTTSRVKMFVVLQDKKLARKLQAVADEYEKLPEFSEKEFDKALNSILEKNFPAAIQPEIKKLLDAFNWEGRGVMLGFLDRARAAGKLKAAIMIVREDLEEHWSYRPKQFRGSFITEKDTYYVQQMYVRLGIPLPTSDST